MLRQTVPGKFDGCKRDLQPKTPDGEGTIVAAAQQDPGALAHPPRPRLVLRVGVTGHRPNRLAGADLAAIEASASASLATLADSAAQIWHAEMALACPAFSPQKPLMRIITALAEGADRIAARAALALKSGRCVIEISCPLPFERALYSRDFGSDASKQEFDALLAKAQSVMELAEPAGADTAQNYLAAGIATLQHADVLLAIWNGKDASGKGGTGEIVQRAANAGIPVIWIKPLTPQAISLIWPKREPYQLSELSIARLLEVAVALDASSLPGLVQSLCSPPEAAVAAATARLLHHGAAKPSRQREALDDFLGRSVPLAGQQNDANWAQFFEHLPGSARPYAQAIATVVMPRYASADQLASLWAAKHRRGYTLNFLLAASAVFFALISVPVEAWKIYATLAEVICISAIIFLTRIGLSQRWHARWIETRLLAENLRQMLFLPLTGTAGGQQRGPAHQAGDAARRWTDFYATAAQREIDLPNLTIDRDYVRATAEALRKGVIEDQIAYHRHRADRFPLHEHRLHLLGAACIFGALLVSLLFLGARAVTCATALSGFTPRCFFSAEHLPDLLEQTKHWVPFLAGVLPAFGAAAYGVRLQSDFDGTQARSREMLVALEALDGAIKAETETMTFARLGEFAGFAAQIMNGDLASWRVVFEGRPLALPG